MELGIKSRGRMVFIKTELKWVGLGSVWGRLEKFYVFKAFTSEWKKRMQNSKIYQNTFPYYGTE